MGQSSPATIDVDAFIERWSPSGGAERANYQLFLSELCDLIGLERPQPAGEQPHENSYVFEKRVPSGHGTTNFIDLYKRDCFVLEAKQGSDRVEAEEIPFSETALRYRQRRKRGIALRETAGWDTAMEKARNQAQRYARNVPLAEVKNGRPPFLITVDVGNTIALYSEFTRTSGNYVPFPDLNDTQKLNIRELAEQLDAHCKRQQVQYRDLTLTDMYNVLEKLRAGEALDEGEREIHEQGLVSFLQQIHDDLDEAVAAVYGWSPDLENDEILQRLVDLNAERAVEEANGLVRWLRPEYHAPDEVEAQQVALLEVEGAGEAQPEPPERQKWPKQLKDRAQAVRRALSLFDGPATVAEVGSAFKGRRTKKRLGQIEEILEMLVALGQAQVDANGRYVTG